MLRTSLLAVTLTLLSGAQAFGFGSKPPQTAPVSGVTEAQVVRPAGKDELSVLVRGRGAELLFKAMQKEREEKNDTPAVKMLGELDTTEWKVAGKQINCSRLARGKAVEYACSFVISYAGNVAGKAETFDPEQFNLSLSKAYASLFRKQGRGLASANPVAFDQAQAYVFYKDYKKIRESEEALLVLQGRAAAEVRAFLTEGSAPAFQKARAHGVKGREISCVEATAASTDRCAMVIYMPTGEITTRRNPLF